MKVDNYKYIKKSIGYETYDEDGYSTELIPVGSAIVRIRTRSINPLDRHVEENIELVYE